MAKQKKSTDKSAALTKLLIINALIQLIKSVIDLIAKLIN